MKRRLSSSLLAISLLAVACSSPTEAEIVAASEAEFGAVMEDVAVAAPAEPVVVDELPASDEIPAELPFEDEAQDSAAASDVLASIPSSDAGICAVVDSVLDLFFDPVSFETLADDLGDGGSLDEILLDLDDGPFGAEWDRFFEAFASSEESGSSADLAEFDREWIAATDQLAVEQCGYPVFTTFIAAISPTCLEPINDDGSQGEMICTPQADPR